jgi:D-alanyl-lipoteichoic acid acyltransferase DltB (MBOAT superfamily)
MLFSSPDYPVFLIAVFFLYGLARWGRGGTSPWARGALMLLLGDIVFMLVAKDPDTLWDPIGGPLLRLVTGGEWPTWAFGHWLIGGLVVAGAIYVGRRWADWIESETGQKKIAVGMVFAIVAIGGAAIASQLMPAEPMPITPDKAMPGWFVGWIKPHTPLDALTVVLIGHGHLLILGILGVGIGAARHGDRNPLGRVLVLFVVSTLFYHAWAAAMPGLYRYLLFLLLGTIVLDYYLGIWIERAKDQATRKLLVIVSLCSNLGILFFFKYYDFFLIDVLQADAEPLRLILPAGISFHTFQSLSYTIDVYRKELPATKSPIEFATFVLFFPQLVAGPIVRAHDLLPQLAKPPPLQLLKATEGLFRVVVGLFKKIAISDSLALYIVDRVFDDPSHFSSIEVLCGVYAYALQIYLDFSAYSDIAIGSAQVLGFDLPENFKTPYRSANIQEFWRRWHISLSTWLRDYLYITLGGSRGAEWRTYFNLAATMLLGGLWHGASWAFIVWGALHGFGLAVTRYFQRATGKHAEMAVKMAVACAIVAAGGYAYLRSPLAPESTWNQLIILWVALTPLWAVLTAWLGRDEKPAPDPVLGTSPLVAMFRGVRGAGFDTALTVELLRIGMCLAGVGFLVELVYAESWTWIPTLLVMWGLGLAADVVERGTDRWDVRLVAVLRRTVAVILVFHYVCLAWVFFRCGFMPDSFDAALAVLRQIAEGDTGTANLGKLVTTAMAAGFVFHFFADGSFRWLRNRFIELPHWARGLVLVGVALVLRQLAHHEIVPFIYFQF